MLTGQLLLWLGTGARCSTRSADHVAGKPHKTVPQIVPPEFGNRKCGPAGQLLGAVQAAPFTPASLHHPYWAGAREILDAPVWAAISVNPDTTWARLIGLLAYGGVFWLAFQLCRPTERARQVLLGLSLAGLIYAVYGLYVYFAGTERVLWLEKSAYQGRVTSTFVNANSYATYAGITLLCGLGLLARELQRHLAAGGASVIRGLVRMLSRTDARIGIGILAVLLCGTALLLTQSRGAFVAILFALALFVAALRRTIGAPSRAVYLGFAAALVASLFGLLQLSGQETVDRFGTAGGNLVDRMTFYRTTWEAIQDRPVLGTGYGTYGHAFRAYNHPETGTFFLDKAHNTYLQLIMELGWPAAAALVLGIGLLVFRCWQGVRVRRRNAAYPAAALACSALVGAHSLVDFSLEMPANAVTYALLLGLGCAQSVQERRGRDAPPTPDPLPGDGRATTARGPPPPPLPGPPRPAAPRA